VEGEGVLPRLCIEVWSVEHNINTVLVDLDGGQCCRLCVVQWAVEARRHRQRRSRNCTSVCALCVTVVLDMLAVSALLLLFLTDCMPFRMKTTRWRADRPRSSSQRCVRWHGVHLLERFL
jgi:hypothetical protein